MLFSSLLEDLSWLLGQKVFQTKTHNANQVFVAMQTILWILDSSEFYPDHGPQCSGSGRCLQILLQPPEMTPKPEPHPAINRDFLSHLINPSLLPF